MGMSEEEQGLGETGSLASPARALDWAYLPEALALAASHFAWVISTKPLPLQEFWPLQELLAVLQAEWPLQEFTPSHLTLASSAALAVATNAVENITAAAAARATLDIFREFIRGSPEYERTEARRAAFYYPTVTITYQAGLQMP